MIYSKNEAFRDTSFTSSVHLYNVKTKILNQGKKKFICN